MLATGTGEMMTGDRKNLYVSDSGDRWDLLRNADGEVFVRHTGNLSSGGHVSDMGLGIFLTLGRNGPEHQAMWRLIGTLLDEAA